LKILSDAVATTVSRFELVDIKKPHQGWRSIGNKPIDIDELGGQWKTDFTHGAKHILKNTWVAASDNNYDAKLWVHMHPYGSQGHIMEGFWCPRSSAGI